MSAEGPTPYPEKPQRGLTRRQEQPHADSAVRRSDPDPDSGDGVGRPGLAANYETLVFAVGDAKGPEARFAARLANVMTNNSSPLRLKIVPNGGDAKALAAVRPQGRRSRDIAHRRQDPTPRPRGRDPRTRRVLLISPGGQKIKSIADLKKKKIAIMADNESSAALVRNILELSNIPNAATRVQMAPSGTTSTSCSLPASAP